VFRSPNKANCLQCGPFLLKFIKVFLDELNFLSEGSEYVNCRCSSVSQRHVALLWIGSPVQVIERAPFEQTYGEASNFVCGSVVDLQLLAAALDIDAALAQRNSVAVNPLVGIANDKEVIRCFWHHRS
jgi:hypothetical protein